MYQTSFIDVIIYNHNDADCINVVVPTRLWRMIPLCVLPSIIFIIITLRLLQLIVIMTNLSGQELTDDNGIFTPLKLN